MKNLHIKFPTVITCVSQYVPQIIEFIEKIIKKGNAYESNGSVYFDTSKYHQQDSYAKLEPDRIDDIAPLSEDEYALKTVENTGKEKKHKRDFVLWRKSNEGEPVWQSGWSLGRPGEHIGCGVRAGNVSNSKFSIHTGDIDSKFLHYDHEIAQSKTYHNNEPWFYYFHHSCHLTIAGLYSSKQLRLLCVLHSWTSTRDYNDHELQKAINYEKMLDDFFLRMQTHLGPLQKFNDSNVDTKLDEHDIILDKCFSVTKSQIHLALCDSIDTSSVMENIHQLISTANNYMNRKNSTVNHILLKNIAAYIKDLINIFGLNFSVSYADDIGFTQSTENQTSTINEEDIATPYVEQFASSRDDGRTEAISIPNKEILPFGYHIKNDNLSGFDVRVEDQGDKNKTTLIFIDKAVLKQAREQGFVVNDSKQEEKEKELSEEGNKEKKNPDANILSEPSTVATCIDEAALVVEDES
ncbi:unnamed protein product [Rotaria sp. Silwood2]|nr:unnamed protein product [Rotaria sp. Silwood2]CAF4445425.1 unnamed protein product [Rotaria sp. Silwood2]